MGPQNHCFDNPGGGSVSGNPARPRVVATRALPGDALAGLATDVDLEILAETGGATAEALRSAVREAQGLLCVLSDRVDAELLAGAAALRVVSSCSVGVDHVDLPAATARGIPVGHTPGVLTETTADLAVALLLAAARRIAEADRFVREGGWDATRGWDPELLLGRDVHGASLGVIGLGPIGRAVARRGRGLGMHVLGWSRSAREVPGVERVTSLAELLGRAEFVSVHVALTPETRGLLDRSALALLRRGAVLVNTARGGIVDEDALAEALAAGRLHGAGLDVYAREPLPPESPLRSLPNVVLAPHIGSASVATRARMAELAVENLRAGLCGERLVRCANPEVYGEDGPAPRAPT